MYHYGAHVGISNFSYKQNKFNLLREQSEGYSKLTTEVTSSLGPPHSTSDGAPVEPQETIDTRAGLAWERVVGLIGYFDLDPNRALDVILDVFSVNIAAHYSFFLSFLAHSPWSSPIHHRPTPNNEDEPMSNSSSSGQYNDKDLDEVLFIAETSSGYPSSRKQVRTSAGGRVLAQVLGFKFSYYKVRTNIIKCGMFNAYWITVGRSHSPDSQELVPDGCTADSRRIHFPRRSIRSCEYRNPIPILQFLML